MSKYAFRGHLEECLKHLAERILEKYPKGSRAANTAKHPIAEFCGTNIHTISDWFFRATSIPQGDRLLRLMCFMELNGYGVIEFERMKPACKNVTQLIGYGVVSGSEATSLLGYGKESTLMSILKGETGLTREREHQFWSIWKARKDSLDQAIEVAQQKYRIDFDEEKVTVVATEKEVPQQVSVPPMQDDKCPRVGVVMIMQGLLNLLDGGVMDNLSATDLAKLAKSNVTILRLSSHLSDLSAKLLKSG